MTNSTPEKPVLVHAENGAAIEVEIFELDVAAFGSFVAEVPPPLAIGTIVLEDGSERFCRGATSDEHVGGNYGSWRMACLHRVKIGENSQQIHPS
jgi:hypothetical protein